MKQIFTVSARIVLSLIVIGVMYALVRFPLTEGRAANLDVISIYSDPLILYTYLSSIPFFFGIFQTFKFLNAIDSGKIFSKETMNTLRRMKVAALTVLSLIVGAIVYIRLFAHGDDPAGVIALGLLAITLCAVCAFVINAFQKRVQIKVK